jgi:hypothetical protein
VRAPSTRSRAPDDAYSSPRFQVGAVLGAAGGRLVANELRAPDERDVDSGQTLDADLDDLVLSREVVPPGR